ncbi:MAG: HEAT repeat domain-containing protein [Planctomycetota bacterium]|nr:MAG: HEAT repeat domain-containing protein [Planctomycetota bacterium]
MLLQLLLSLLQEPGSDWPQADRDALYDAIHLLEVSGQPARAVDLLTLLAENHPPERAPSDHPLILAHLARALASAGRTDEAGRYVAEARRLASGTMRESTVLQLLDSVTALTVPQDALDPNFQSLVREALDNDAGIASLQRYGRRILPYLLAELERAWPLAPEHEQLLMQRTGRILQIGFPVADAEFRTRVQKLLANAPVPMLEHLLASIRNDRFSDDAAREQYDRWLYEGSFDADPTRARAFAVAAARVLHNRGSELLGLRLGVILSSPDDPLAPFLVDALPWRKGQARPPFRDTDLPMQAARSPQALVAQEARWRMYQAEWVPELAALLADGDIMDQVRYVRLMLCYGGVEADTPEAEVYRRLDERIVERGGRGSNTATFNNPADAAPYLPPLRQLLEASDPLVRAGAALALMAHEDEAGAALALRSADAAVVHLALRGLQRWRTFPSAWDARIQGYLDDTVLQEAAAKALLQGAPRLTAEVLAQILLQGVESEPQRLDYVFGTWMQTTEGLAKLREFVQRPDVHPKFKEHVYAMLVSFEPVHGAEAFAVFEGAGEARNERLGRVLAYSWVPYLAASAVQQGELTPQVTHAFHALLNYRGDPYYSALIQLLAGKVPGAAEFVADLLESPQGSHALFQGLLGAMSSTEDRSWGPTLLVALLQRGILTDTVWKYAGNLRVGDGYDREAVAFLLQHGNHDFAEQALRMLRANPEQVANHEKDVLHWLRDPGMAARAASALAAAGAQYVPELVQAWEEVSVENRVSYIGALGDTGDERVVPVLMGTLGSPRAEIRAAADKALDELKKLREQREFWEAWQITGAGPSPVAALIPKLKSDKLEVRVAAIESLGTLRAKEALPLLVELLEDKEPRIAEAAKKALAKINE